MEQAPTISQTDLMSNLSNKERHEMNDLKETYCNAKALRIDLEQDYKLGACTLSDVQDAYDDESAALEELQRAVIGSCKVSA